MGIVAAGKCFADQFDFGTLNEDFAVDFVDCLVFFFGAGEGDFALGALNKCGEPGSHGLFELGFVFVVDFVACPDGGEDHGGELIGLEDDAGCFFSGGVLLGLEGDAEVALESGAAERSDEIIVSGGVFIEGGSEDFFHHDLVAFVAVDGDIVFESIDADSLPGVDFSAGIFDFEDESDGFCGTKHGGFGNGLFVEDAGDFFASVLFTESGEFFGVCAAESLGFGGDWFCGEAKFDRFEFGGDLGFELGHDGFGFGGEAEVEAGFAHSIGFPVIFLGGGEEDER